MKKYFRNSIFVALTLCTLEACQDNKQQAKKYIMTTPIPSGIESPKTVNSRLGTLVIGGPLRSTLQEAPGTGT